MEVCYSCHEPLKKTDKTITGDPAQEAKVMKGIVGNAWSGSYNQNNKNNNGWNNGIRNNTPEQEVRRYHLDCFEQEKIQANKDGNKAILYIFIILIAMCLIVWIPMYFLVIKG